MKAEHNTLRRGAPYFSASKGPTNTAKGAWPPGAKNLSVEQEKKKNTKQTAKRRTHEERRFQGRIQFQQHLIDRSFTRTYSSPYSFLITLGNHVTDTK